MAGKKLVRIYKNEEAVKDILPNIPVLGSAKYLASKSKDYGWFVSDNLILPFIIDKKLIFKRMIFTLETIYVDKEASIEEEKAFLDGVVELSKKENLADFIAKAQSYTVFKTYPTKSIHIPWGTYELGITDSMDDILASFNRSIRRAIRKANQDGVEIRFNINAKEVYELVYETVLRGKSFACPPYGYFKEAQENLKDNCVYLGAYKDDKLQSVLTVLFDEKRGYELYCGNAIDSHKGSSQLVKFEAMRYIKEKCNTPVYDFCGARINVIPGSKYASIQEYKEHFHPILVEGYAFKVILNPLKTKIFHLLVGLYAKKHGQTYVDPIDQLLTEY